MNMLGNGFLPQVKAGSSPTLSMLDYEGCILWFDSADTSKIFVDEGFTTVSADGQAVALYTDKSPDEMSILSDPGAEPLYKVAVRNGHSVIRFDGIDDTMRAFLGQAAGDLTVFVAADIPDQAEGTYKYLFDSETGRLILAALGDTPGSVQFYDGSWSAAAVAATGWQLLTFHLAATGATIYRNGVSIATGSYTQKGLFGNSRIGSNFVPDGSYLAMDLGDMVMYSRALPTEEREAIEAHLMAKWGL